MQEPKENARKKVQYLIEIDASIGFITIAFYTCEIFLLRRRDLKIFGIHFGCCGWHYFAVHNRQHSVIHFIQEIFEVFSFQILITEFKCLKRCVVEVDMAFYSTKVNWKNKVTYTFLQNKKHSI